MKDASVLARNLIEEHNTNNPFKLCKILGIHVQRHHLKDTELRGYYIKRKGISIITVANELDDDEASFVCGHELGHDLLDGNSNRIFLDKYTYSIPNKYENRADKFSAHLHWGKPPLFEETYLTDWDIARCLNIPVCSVNERLLELGIFY